MRRMRPRRLPQARRVLRCLRLSRRRWAVLVVLAGLFVVAWPSASQARPGERIECYEDPGLAEDIKDVFRTVRDWFSGDEDEHLDDLDHAEEADFDATGKPAWLVTEVREHKECWLVDKMPVEPCPDNITNYESQGLVPDNCWGTYPTSAYELSHEGPQGPFDFAGYGRMFSGLLTRLFFNIATTFVSAALWLIQWAFRFDIGDISGVATRVGGRYQNRFVAPSGLEYTAWLVLVTWAGFTALRGRLSVAGGELLLSIVMASLAAVLIHDITSGRGDYLESASARIEEASGAVLMTSAAEDPTDVEDMDVATALRPLQRELHEVFVEQPYDYLNWGKPLTGACATVRNNVLSVTTAQDDGLEYAWARRYMKRQGCEEEAKFNRSPTGSRWVGAMLNMIVAAILLGVLALVALTVAISKFTVAALFAVAPFFAVAAILPGRGRRIAWSWLSTLGQMALAVVALSTLLSIMVVAADGVLEATDERSLFERWLLQLALMGAVFVGRRRMLHSLNAFAHWFQDTLSRTSPGFAGQPMAPPSRAGVDLAQADLGAQYGAIGVGFAAVLAGRSYLKRSDERRVTRRRMESAKTIERYKEIRDNTPRRMARTWIKGSKPRVARQIRIPLPRRRRP